MKVKLIAALGAVTALVSPATAATTLTFEGLGNLQEVGSFYAPDYIFSPGTLALVDSDAGGTGNIANEPSGDTVMVFLDSNNAILDVAGGFDTGFSFFYSAAFAGSVTVYDGMGGTGNVLATLNLDAQFNNNCVGDPSGQYCNWTPIGVAFSGTAFSIDFGGTANFIVYDDITFGSVTPGGVVPEPASWAMMIGGFGLVGGAMRRRRSIANLATA